MAQSILLALRAGFVLAAGFSGLTTLGAQGHPAHVTFKVFETSGGDVPYAVKLFRVAAEDSRPDLAGHFSGLATARAVPYGLYDYILQPVDAQRHSRHPQFTGRLVVDQPSVLVVRTYSGNGSSGIMAKSRYTGTITGRAVDARNYWVRLQSVLMPGDVSDSQVDADGAFALYCAPSGAYHLVLMKGAAPVQSRIVQWRNGIPDLNMRIE